VSVVTGTAVNQGSRILVDALIALGLPARHELDIGQFKIPIGLEGGVQSPAVLETVERALYTSDRARGGIYGDSRDIGILLRGPSGDDVEYSAGIFNGVGENQNDTDHNQAKAVVGRIVARVPFVRQLAVGGSGAFTTRSSPDSIIRRRAGVEAKLVVGPFLAKSEYMSGRDAARRGEGWYGHLGYSITPRLNLIARQDVFDPDIDRETSLTDARERDWIAGFTYDVVALNVRLQMNYLRKTFSPAISPDRGLLLTNLQAAW
jgi:phosphate-selective porin